MFSTFSFKRSRINLITSLFSFDSWLRTYIVFLAFLLFRPFLFGLGRFCIYCAFRLRDMLVFFLPLGRADLSRARAEPSPAERAEPR